ncbi:Putative pre-mRNA processing factor 4 (PRP4), PRP4-like superfamily, pre-mRNA-splicing factor 18 [Septoria linicola]|uniref:Pre-mRNA-splicing factor 18 n=1 Tax=Septoria linicola TaxID=215465 RepID=A0A9Q9ANU5_9PEZI|nr:putative pre-mRNA processing factor 4 (PRP4), PRP4-like superfamily, pre-mRNA-splicing factor 18 [Septoria linicola]USW49371.1 Putative pre-mRNA processing factor 4 (PRP4), PRP4-like superfamily, pre-mRNA-splicing factor 18 [Septoria linicola]
MDFAALMKSQIASSSSAKASSDSGNKKYLKRSEVEVQRQAEYAREQAQLEKERLERLDKKRKRDEDEAERVRAREEKRQRLAEESRKVREEEEEAEERARRKRLGLSELVKKDSEATPLKEGEQDIAEEELLIKLHDLGEPRILFGETHIERLRRYRKLTAKALAPKLSTGPIPTTLELVPEAEMKVPESVPKDPEAYQFLLRQLASYFDMLLSEWQNALARRDKEVKESSTGKQAYNSFLAAKDNLKSLFKKLETNTVEAAILPPVLEIVDLAQKKRYVDANDAYLRLSIGKAAWPIGVTMVGIHERSAREKLHGENNQAHILSDETTRKMLQGIKRCLSFAQTRWPPSDIGQLMG